jgi:hypothetical protein
MLGKHRSDTFYSCEAGSHVTEQYEVTMVTDLRHVVFLLRGVRTEAPKDDCNILSYFFFTWRKGENKKKVRQNGDFVVLSRFCLRTGERNLHKVVTLSLFHLTSLAAKTRHGTYWKRAKALPDQSPPVQKCQGEQRPSLKNEWKDKSPPLKKKTRRIKCSHVDDRADIHKPSRNKKYMYVKAARLQKIEIFQENIFCEKCTNILRKVKTVKIKVKLSMLCAL